MRGRRRGRPLSRGPSNPAATPVIILNGHREWPASMPAERNSSHQATKRTCMDDLPIITTIAVAFTAAWLWGLLTQRLGLSPIVGYLLAGVLIGPHTPGF